MRDLGTLAPAEAPALEEEEQRPARRQRSGYEWGAQIASELVKPYGFKRNPSTSEWSWNAETIAESYRDHPFWTAVDHLSLAVPFLKWGTAARAVMKGSSYYAKAYQAGEIGLARGVRLHHAAPSVPSRAIAGVEKTPTIRVRDLGQKILETIENPAARYVDPELVARYGTGDPMEVRGLGLMASRERVAAESYNRKMLERVARYERKIPVDESRLTQEIRLLDPASPDYAAKFAQLSPRAQRIVGIQLPFINELHERSAALGLITKEVYERGYKGPRLYEEFVPEYKGGLRRGTMEGGGRHYTKRESHPELTELLTSATLEQDALARAAHIVAEQEWAMKILRSRATLDEASLLQRTGFNAALPDARKRELLTRQLFPDYDEQVRAALPDRTLKDAWLNHLLKTTGWKRAEELVPGKDYRVRAELGRRQRSLGQAFRARTEHLKDWRQLQEIIHAQEGRLGEIKLRTQLQRIAASVAGDATGRDLLRRAASLSTRRGKEAVRQRSQQSALEAAQEVTTQVTEAKAQQALLDNAAELRRLVGPGYDALLERMDGVMRRRGKRLQTAIARAETMVQRETMRNEARFNNHFLKHMPAELRERFVDPLVADDFAASLDMIKKNPIIRTYLDFLGAFKTTHTALNPATHARNFLGGAVTASFSVGLASLPRVIPSAIADLRAGGPMAKKALQSGAMGTSFDNELVKRVIANVGGDTLEEQGKSWMRWMTDLGKQGVSRARDIYAGGDDLWKLGSFITHYKRATKAGLSEEDAIGKATLEGLRYIPTFSASSPLAQVARPIIPFVSFPVEAARVWKNAMIYKPHLAFFWNHVAETASSVTQMQMGVSQGEIEASRESLPWYTQTKKMLMLPYRDNDGKLSFWDLSYVIPLADFGAEAQQAENTFFGIPLPHQLLNPTTNPLFGMASAWYQGTDPMSGRPTEPRFLEQQLGVPVPPGARVVAGAFEYMLRAMVPPLVPPGYAGTNLLELARGQKSGATDQPLEHDPLRTILSNFAGIRTYEPTVSARIMNVRRELRQTGEATTQSWDRWEFAMANGDLKAAEEERKRLSELKGFEYFRDNMKDHVPGAFSNISQEVLADVIVRAGRFQAKPEELWPVYVRYLELRGRE